MAGFASVWKEAEVHSSIGLFLAESNKLFFRFPVLVSKTAHMVPSFIWCFPL